MAEAKRKIARLLKSNLRGFTGTAHLYKLRPSHERAKFVVVSQTNAMFTGAETYIFPANRKGEVTNWGELSGSVRGSYSPESVLESLGYTIEKR